LRDLRRETCIEDEFIRELDGLAHIVHGSILLPEDKPGSVTLVLVVVLVVVLVMVGGTDPEFPSGPDGRIRIRRDRRPQRNTGAS
jgi:hypothetical protein